MSKKRLLPPTFEEVYAQMGLKDSVEQDKQKSLGGFGKPVLLSFCACVAFVDVNGLAFDR